MVDFNDIFDFAALEAEMSDHDKRVVNNIARNIRNKDCILFLGAGANACSVENEVHYSRDNKPPTGWELSQILREELRTQYNYEFDENKVVTLSNLAQYYEHISGDRLELGHLLRRHIAEGKTPSPVLYMLACLPFEFVITTNYDRLFETALETVKGTVKDRERPAVERIENKKPFKGIYQSDRFHVTENVPKTDISEQRPFIYKIHGDIEDDQSIVITDEDYIHFILRMSDKNDYNPVPRVFSDVLSKKSILFVGYRLMDYNLRLLFKTIRWGKDINLLPLNYSIDPSPDDFIKEIIYNNYKTNFIVLDSWKIIPLLYKAVLNNNA